MKTKKRLRKALIENEKIRYLVSVLVEGSVGDLVEKLKANARLRAETKDELSKEEPAQEVPWVKNPYYLNQEIIEDLVGKYIMIDGWIYLINHVDSVHDSGERIYVYVCSVDRPDKNVKPLHRLNLDENIYFDEDCKNIFFNGEKHELRKENDNA